MGIKKSRWFFPGLFLLYSVPLVLATHSYSQIEKSPLEFLREQEFRHKEEKGEVYLGRVMTVYYEVYSVDADNKYHPIFLELTDLLKSPLRESYRIVMRGYSDNSGSPIENLELSARRAEGLKRLFIKEYFMKEERITAKGFGEADPVSSNETAQGRRLNRRVEVHIYGDVSEAVRFLKKEEEGQ